MAKKTRSYSVKTKDLVSYEDITNRIEELKESAGWTDNDDGTAAEKFEAFYDASCTIVGSDGQSDDELQEAREVLETVSEMAPGLTDKNSEELQKYCHRQALYDTLIAPIEAHIQSLMNGEDLTETAEAFTNSVNTYGQSVFEEMKEMMGTLELMRQTWQDDDDEINKAMNKADSTKKRIQERLQGINYEDLKGFASEKLTEGKEAGSEAYGATKRSMSKALAIFTRKKTASEKFDEMFDQAREIVESFKLIKSDMRATKKEMEDIVKDTLEPLYRQSQELKKEQVEIVRKLSYQIAAGEEMMRIFKEDVLPEIDRAEQETEDLDPLQLEGFKAIRDGYKDFDNRITLLASQKQEASALTQTLNMTIDSFKNQINNANTFNNETSISMQRSMNVLELSLNQLDMSMKDAQRNNLANEMFQNIIRVAELNETMQQSTNSSVDPELILEARQSIANITKRNQIRNQDALAINDKTRKMIEASDACVSAVDENDGSEEAKSRIKETEDNYKKVKDELTAAKEGTLKKTKLLDNKAEAKKPSKKKADNDNDRTGHFNKKTEAPVADEKPKQQEKKPASKFAKRNQQP